MKTVFFVSTNLILCLIMIITLPNCGTKKNKRKPPVVVTNSSALTAGQKLEKAIDARVGEFSVFGRVDKDVFPIYGDKKLLVSKISASTIKVQAINFTMNEFEFVVKNGTKVDANGNVFGSEDGTAIAYTNNSPSGQIIFACDETNTLIFSIAGIGNNDISLIGTR
jgi:hypothetical protein